MQASQKQIVEHVAAVVRSRMEGEGSGHDWWHVHRVWQTARRISKIERADMYEVELTALLHDIADWKFTDGDESAGPREARRILEDYNVTPDIIGRVCASIRHLSYKGAGVPDRLTTLEGKIAQDADRLDALGAIGIARAFAYGGHKNRQMYDPDIKPEIHTTKEAYMGAVGTTVNHFYEKLLLLKDRMNTVEGKRMAVERHHYMKDFLQEFYDEWDGRR